MAKKSTQTDGAEDLSFSATDPISAAQAEIENIDTELSEAVKAEQSLLHRLRDTKNALEILEERHLRATHEHYVLSSMQESMKRRLHEAPRRLMALRCDPDRIAWVKEVDLDRFSSGNLKALVMFQRAIEGLAFYIASGDAKIRRLDTLIGKAKERVATIADSKSATSAEHAALKAEAEKSRLKDDAWN